MAKKKGNKSNAVSVETLPRSSDDAAAQPLASGGSETQLASEKAVEQMDVAELKAELIAAREELAKLRSQAEPAAGKLAKPQEVQELHVKLQQLRKEQEEADQARDKAWMQLKVCSMCRHLL